MTDPVTPESEQHEVMSKLCTPQCASAVKLAGENKQCVYRDGHDGMHRAYTLWSDSGYIEWASGNALSFDVAKTSPRLHLRLVESRKGS